MKDRKWPEEKRREVVAELVAHGSWKRASEATGVPLATIRYWHEKNRDWWDKVEQELYQGISAATKGKFNRIINLAQDGIIDRLRNGDEKVLSSGKVVRQKVSMRDLVLAMGVSYDKDQAQRLRESDKGGDQTQAQEVSGNQMLEAFKKTLREAHRQNKKAAEAAASDPGSNVKVLS